MTNAYADSYEFDNIMLVDFNTEVSVYRATVNNHDLFVECKPYPTGLELVEAFVAAVKAESQLLRAEVDADNV